MTICRCCGEVAVYVEGAEVYRRHGPFTVAGFRSSCRYAARLLRSTDVAAADELAEFGRL